ncbi:hypothetical protein C1752_00456 [Acaryochloris thomasi RCC1774]|uniref:DUF3326 domain-containing protein n=1 Tax=Acaryochloris thomasi RCC1774 TaxID=1764569 RepID=A0A2W1JYV7_9CYAN|nr:DUF3326 domain-containing protein [Acaryochloris thomasi]PZD75142.1 hypothetical protein C1752_00456 [Acaryochloris thomasi RCC1774]
MISRRTEQPFTVALVVPTGIGAEIGGYAGDALPVARGIASVCDRIITHPNVMNGAQLYWPIENALYVEGYGLDQYAAGNWGLRPVRSNRVGLVLDQGIEPDLRLRHLQVADAARATLGLQLTDAILTDAPLNVTLKTAASGATWGTIENPDSLLRAVERSINELGADAIAVVARFPDDIEAEALQSYRQGQGVDPLAGAEAVISHLVVRTFQIPCAHAPALEPLPVDPQVSPRSAAEELGYTFLSSVLVGLSRAPQFVQQRGAADLWAEGLDAIVVPETACGGSAILSLSQKPTRIIAVNNPTALQVTPDELGIEVTKVRSYLEAMGVLAAQRAGLDISALTPALGKVACLTSNN